MKLHRFRVCNFRSISDSGWLPFSVDNLTVLVGQNESGKSALLDGLGLAFSAQVRANPDDFRLGEPLPSAHLEVELADEDWEDLRGVLEEEWAEQDVAKVRQLLPKVFQLKQELAAEGTVWSRDFSLADEALRRRIKDATESAEPLRPVSDVNDAAEADGDADARAIERKQLLIEVFESEVWHHIPGFVLFRETESVLPNRIEIVDGALKGEGAAGARNFMTAGGLELKQLLAADDRVLSTLLGRANASVTKQLQDFWSQYNTGSQQKIRVECELRRFPSEDPKKAGLPYLAFWVAEGAEKLYPSQRSRGTRWFISFFLTLVAAKKKSAHAVFVLDEPGAFLHASAQRDVLRLMEGISQNVPVMYSTHSQDLIDHKKLYRILAVERKDTEADSVTVVRNGLELGAASPLTLAPVLALIGVDLSRQQVIRTSGNVILEEASVAFYLEAFRRLLGLPDRFALVAASGVDNVALIFDLFTAWSLECCVLTDDDPHGKKVRREIKAKYHLADARARRLLLGIDGCNGSEDLFTIAEFCTLVLRDGAVQADGRASDHVKRKRLPKAYLALQFLERVKAGEITERDLSAETLGRASALFASFEAAFETQVCSDPAIA